MTGYSTLNSPHLSSFFTKDAAICSCHLVPLLTVLIISCCHIHLWQLLRLFPQERGWGILPKLPHTVCQGKSCPDSVTSPPLSATWVLVWYLTTHYLLTHRCQAGKASFAEFLGLFSLTLAIPLFFFLVFLLILNLSMCALYIFLLFHFHYFPNDAVGVLLKSLCLKALHSQLFL